MRYRQREDLSGTGHPCVEHTLNKNRVCPPIRINLYRHMYIHICIHTYIYIYVNMYTYAVPAT